jgi:hypothetical protein
VQLTAFDKPYIERIIGSIRREWLDYLIIFNEAHLRLIFRSQPLPIVSSSGLKSRQSQSSTNLMRERYEIVSRDSGER